jgi:hypothetical protein
MNVVKKTNCIAPVDETIGRVYTHHEVLTFNDKHRGAISRVQAHIHIHESSTIHNLQIVKHSLHLDPPSTIKIESRQNLQRGTGFKRKSLHDS